MGDLCRPVLRQCAAQACAPSQLLSTPCCFELGWVAWHTDQSPEGAQGRVHLLVEAQLLCVLYEVGKVVHCCCRTHMLLHTCSSEP
jgi:hypothetical protein